MFKLFIEQRGRCLGRPHHHRKSLLSNKRVNMLYRSTRGHEKLLTFKEAVLQGLAPDGGLYIPLTIPKFKLEEISTWSNLSFDKLAFKLYRPFISEEEIPNADLQSLCTKSFATFTHKETTPVKPLPKLNSAGDLGNLWVLELFHGPTFAFKDVALQFLGNLFEYFLSKDQAHKGITVLGATSGDTGGAAIYGLRGKKKIEVFILHPHKRVSPIQEAQMTSVLDSNGRHFNYNEQFIMLPSRVLLMIVKIS